MKEITRIHGQREWRAVFHFSFKNGSFEAHVFAGGFQNDTQLLNWRKEFIAALVERCRVMIPAMKLFLEETSKEFRKELAWQWKAWHIPDLAAIFFLSSAIRSWIEISNASDFK